ncbi:D-alanyl-D-alanine carboxypeptidase [Corynebacterium lizhenjunii]|uniref:D-alanyl-D-alanine carboxypeptidase n=1 Tax=Corynebacterium lizhenjunii TaxID=2709394 RepID=A0A7T0PBH8_9CORY|nr:D-alanyl-D-alanine carboxypeptidase family protein [Corynebacterium lizhenjunii]QPK78732.1 D-alanyl-D-alanine carboxypeptidase [Corynebacterium lizhenjunii]
MKKPTAACLAAVMCLGPAGAQLADAAEPTTRHAAPNTDDCPQLLQPPEPTTTSERLAPGQLSPTPLPPAPETFCGVLAPAGFRVDPEVYAAAWMVSDLDTGEVLAMKDPHGRYRPASIIKVLLALVAIERLDLGEELTVSAESADQEGSAVGLGAGGHYTVEQLLQGLIMASGNDAAHALAQRLGGDAAALELVNAKARELGTTGTVAASYSGLDAPGMSTSAADMSVMYRAAFANPTFARIAATESVKFPGYDDLPEYEVWNDNGLFMNDEDGIGGKTGYTDDAHHTFVGALNRDGRRLMAVLLDTTIDHGPRAWQQAQLLLHEAYRLPPGTAVASLSELADTPSPTAEPIPAPPTPSLHIGKAEQARPSQPEWIGWLAVGLVGALALGVAAFTLRPRNNVHRGGPRR